MVVFGGGQAYNDRWVLYLNDSWALSLDAREGALPTWTQLLPTGALPAGRWGQVAIYDPPGDQMVIWGGTNSGTGIADIWALEWAADGSVAGGGDLALSSTVDFSPDRGISRVLRSSPNPFNPATTIRYDVPAAGGRLLLGVYDVDGQLVRELFDGDRGPGSYAVLWDGRDAQGRVLASGIYFCRIELPGSSETIKLVLSR